MRSVLPLRYFCTLVLLYLLPGFSYACGYDYVSSCAHRLDISINGVNTLFKVGTCSWMNEFQNYQFGTPNTLQLSRVNSITWESCTNRVMNATLYYRIYLTGNTPGSFLAMPLTDLIYDGEGTYHDREYYKQPNLNLLSGLAGGNYTLELYYQSDVDFNNDNIIDAQLIRNNNGSNYKAYFTKAGPPPCSINTTTSNIVCNDSGTPNNPGDDTFTFSMTVSGNNTGTGWSAVIAGQQVTGAYGIAISPGTYPISGGNLTFTVTDNSLSTCTSSVTVTAPLVCSNGSNGCNKNVLVVVGNGASPAPADMAIINRLTGPLGAAVTIADDGIATAADASGKQLVIITATVKATLLGTKFRDVAVPVLIWKKDLFADMQITGSATNSSGSINNLVNGVINLPSHPLAAGLSGSVPLFNSGSTAYWGVPLASASKVVRLTNSKCLVFAYEAGAALANMTAPAKRIGFFLHTTFSGNLTNSGWSIFDAAVNWSTGCPVNIAAPDVSNLASVSAPADIITETTFSDAELRIYPNPVTDDRVYLDFQPQTVSTAIVVVNVLGQLVIYSSRSAGDTTPVEIMTYGLSPGVYYLRITRMDDGDGYLTGSFLISR